MTSNTKRILYIVSGLLFLISFAGMLFYGYKTFYIEAEHAENLDYTYHFALIAEEMDNDYWRLIEKGAKKAAAENDVYMEYVAPQKADNDEMLKLLDRMISAKVDGIIIQGIEGERFVDLVHKGVERGIPIITVDTDIKSSERKAYVGTDNHHAGRLLGQSVIENTTGEQFVGIVTGRLAAVNQQVRVEGFKEAVAAVDRIHVVDTKESNITEIGAAQATYSLLKQNPQITALVGTSALDGIGMVEGVREIAPNRDIFIAAFDILPRTLNLIRENQLDATVAQYPEEMGSKALDVLMQLQTSDLLENQIYTGTKVIDKDNLPKNQRGGIE